MAPAERRGLSRWLTDPQCALFDEMHVADQRHGLDVVATLQASGVRDPDILVAGLLHDAAKGQTGIAARTVYALGQHYGPWIWRSTGLLPRSRAVLKRLAEHAEVSARMAAAAGCTPRTVELIRHQDAPLDPVAGRQLQLADDAN